MSQIPSEDRDAEVSLADARARSARLKPRFAAIRAAIEF